MKLAFRFETFIFILCWSLSALAEHGFYTVDHERVPLAVREASESVLQVRVVVMSESGMGIEDLTQKTEQDVLDSFAQGSLDDMNSQILREQLRFCRSSGDPERLKKCYISTDISSATAFFIGDGKTLWTNAHVVESFMKAVTNLAKISIQDQIRNRQNILLFLFNSSGEMLVNPYDNKVRIDAGPELTAMARAQNNFYAEDSDYIRLALERAISVAPLEIADARAAVGDDIFVVGYPGCTGCDASTYNVVDPESFLDRSPAPNSPGHQLRVSFGEVLDPLVGFPRLGLLTSTAYYFHPLQFQLNTADSQHGNSGGPVFNAEGKVVAIHAGGKTILSDGRMVDRVSRSVIPPSFFGN